MARFRRVLEKSYAAGAGASSRERVLLRIVGREACPRPAILVASVLARGAGDEGTELLVGQQHPTLGDWCQPNL